jgi:hypothetical protein
MAETPTNSILLKLVLATTKVIRLVFTAYANHCYFDSNVLMGKGTIDHGNMMELVP